MLPLPWPWQQEAPCGCPNVTVWWPSQHRLTVCRHWTQVTNHHHWGHQCTAGQCCWNTGPMRSLASRSCSSLGDVDDGLAALPLARSFEISPRLCTSYAALSSCVPQNTHLKDHSQLSRHSLTGFIRVSHARHCPIGQCLTFAVCCTPLLGTQQI